MALLATDVRAMSERKVSNLITKLNTAMAKYEQMKSTEPDSAQYYDFELTQINMKLDFIAEIRAQK